MLRSLNHSDTLSKLTQQSVRWASDCCVPKMSIIVRELWPALVESPFSNARFPQRTSPELEILAEICDFSPVPMFDVLE